VIWISYVVSAVSLTCTLTNLWLIYIMKKWNGYLAIITSMCCCQIVYDLSFALHISANDGTTAIAVWNALQFFGGISVSIWTNILAFVILRVVVNLKSTDIMKNFYRLSAIALIPAFLTGLLILGMQLTSRQDRIYAVESFYYWARIASIVANFTIHGVVALKTYRINSVKTWTQRTPQEIAIQILSHRMIYYPMMQALSRVGASWYEALYGYGPYEGETSNYQFSLACLYAGLSPATGIGYVVVFLLMQPYAVEQIKSLLFTGRTIDPKVFETQKRQRRESFLNRSTLISGALGSDIVGTSSLTSHGDLSHLNHQVSSLTYVPPSVKEEVQEFQCMDDDELVATIHRAEQRGTYFRRQFNSEVGGRSTVTGATNGTETTNPVLSVATGVVHSGRVDRVGKGKGVDIYHNDQL
jgi:hypothetical protein